MPHLRRIWLGMRTRNEWGHAGTDSPIELVVNQNGQDVVSVTFPPTPQADQEIGQANLYAHGLVDASFDPNQLGIPPTPLAIETDMDVRLSTDADEGVSSTAIRQVASGKPNTPIERLLMLMTTGRSGAPSTVTARSNTFLDLRAGPGTDSPIQLQIVRQGSLILQYDIPDTPQRDQENRQANLYLFPVPAAFTRESLQNNAITLSIKGTDAWLPSKMEQGGGQVLTLTIQSGK